MSLPRVEFKRDHPLFLTTGSWAANAVVRHPSGDEILHAFSVVSGYPMALLRDLDEAGQLQLEPKDGGVVVAVVENPEGWAGLPAEQMALVVRVLRAMEPELDKQKG